MLFTYPSWFVSNLSGTNRIIDTALLNTICTSLECPLIVRNDLAVQLAGLDIALEGKKWYDAYHHARNATIKTLKRVNERRQLNLSSSANWQQFAVENIIFSEVQVHESLVLITNAYA